MTVEQASELLTKIGIATGLAGLLILFINIRSDRKNSKGVGDHEAAPASKHSKLLNGIFLGQTLIYLVITVLGVSDYISFGAALCGFWANVVCWYLVMYLDMRKQSAAYLEYLMRRQKGPVFTFLVASALKGRFKRDGASQSHN